MTPFSVAGRLTLTQHQAGQIFGITLGLLGPEIRIDVFGGRTGGQFDEERCHDAVLFVQPDTTPVQFNDFFLHKAMPRPNVRGA